VSKTKPPLIGHVVSHTHWDRAWYLPFELFRIRLVTLMKKLLAIMERDPNYIFCFDGQTVPFDDYLEICPEDRDRIVRLVKARRLHVGPFYCLPDQYLVTGETLIRNIAIGLKEARALGRVQMEGALSDVFGHPSQIPQILSGFGIRSALFVRGLTPEQKKAGLIQNWFAPDGKSSVLMYFLPGQGYASLYYWGMDSFDPALYPTIPTDAAEWSVDLAEKHLKDALDAFAEGSLASNQVWLGNGVDHQEAQPHTPALIRELNKRQSRIHLVHSTYERLMNAVRAEGRRLPKITGQFRLGLHGTMTSRVYQKQAYSSIAGRTEMIAEPLLALADVYARGHRAFRELDHSAFTHNPGQNWASFPFHPSGQLEYLWKLLLRNTPHDDICGCSVDATHQDMDNRFKRAREISEYLASDSLLLLASRLAESRPDSKTPVLVAFNPHPFAVKDRIRASVFIERRVNAGAIALRDRKGRAVPFVVDSATPLKRRPWDGNEFVKTPIDGTVLTLSFLPDLAPCSLASFDIVTDAKMSRAPKTLAVASASRVKKGASSITVDTPFARVTLRRNGTFDLLDKSLGRRFWGLGLLEDVEDAGDSYKFIRFDKPGRPVTSKNVRARLRVLSHDSLSTSVEASFAMKLPASLVPERTARSRETVLSPVRLILEIPHHRPGGRIRVLVDNKAKDHQLSLVLPTGIAADSFEFDSKFDYDSYPIGEEVPRIDSVSIVRDRGASSRAAAFGIVTECPTLCYSRRERGRAVLCLPLFRSVDHVTKDIPVELWPAREAECLRTIERTFDWVTGRHDDVKSACLRLRRTIVAPVAVLPVTPWTANRYLDKLYTTLPLPEGSFITVDGDSLQLSAWKKSESGTGWIVRIYSLAAKSQQCFIASCAPVKSAHLCDLAETPLTALRRAASAPGKSLSSSAKSRSAYAPPPITRFSFRIGPKEIKTVLLTLDDKTLSRHMHRKAIRRVGKGGGK
jgi:hypothetical protein